MIRHHAWALVSGLAAGGIHIVAGVEKRHYFKMRSVILHIKKHIQFIISELALFFL